MNAIDFLIKEHDKVRKMLADICNESHRFETKKEIFNELCRDIILHETMEHKIWYPHFKNDSRISQEVKHLLSEEKAAEKEINKFNTEELEKDWDKKFLKFKTDVEHHADEEEAKLFPQVKKILGDEKLNEIGDAMREFKKEHAVIK